LGGPVTPRLEDPLVGYSHEGPVGFPPAVAGDGPILAEGDYPVQSGTERLVTLGVEDERETLPALGSRGAGPVEPASEPPTILGVSGQDLLEGLAGEEHIPV